MFKYKNIGDRKAIVHVSVSAEAPNMKIFREVEAEGILETSVEINYPNLKLVGEMTTENGKK